MTPAKLQELAREAGAIRLVDVAAPSRRTPLSFTDAALATFGALVRAAALEEAARRVGDVEPVTYHFGGQTYDDARATLGACESAVRALAQQAGGRV